jgi:hypothetical protein
VSASRFDLGGVIAARLRSAASIRNAHRYGSLEDRLFATCACSSCVWVASCSWTRRRRGMPEDLDRTTRDSAPALRIGNSRSGSGRLESTWRSGAIGAGVSDLRQLLPSRRDCRFRTCAVPLSGQTQSGGRTPRLRPQPTSATRIGVVPANADSGSIRSDAPGTTARGRPHQVMAHGERRPAQRAPTFSTNARNATSAGRAASVRPA